MHLMIKRILFLLLIYPALSACDRHEHYAAPDWLQGPLFDQIESTGKYNEFVKVARTVGYDQFLNSRNTFTLFLPTDEAFIDYYNEIGVGGHHEIDPDQLLTLLQYHTMQNAWDSVKMAGKTTWGFWTNNVQNFRTPSLYAPPVKEENGFMVYRDQTFLHLFTTPFFAINSFQEKDYESFFPGSFWTGHHIDRGTVLEAEAGAENGFYYVIDKVLHPRTSADMVISQIESFSQFYEFLNTFIRYDLDLEKSAESREHERLYKKNYTLNFNLSDERIRTSDPDGFYQVMNTMFIPENQAIYDYFADKFPHYSSLQDIPPIVLKYFLEAHMITNKILFPSVLERPIGETNEFSDIIPYKPGQGITSQTLSSNAIIYGVDEAIHSNAFSTVSGPYITQPSYNIFVMMLEQSDEIRSFFKPEIRHVGFVLSDQRMTGLGFRYAEGDPSDFTDGIIFRNNIQLTPPRMREFLESFISITSKDVDGQTERFIRTKDNQYLRIADGKVSGVFGEANIVKVYETINGTVIEVDRNLATSRVFTIENYLNDNKQRFSRFFELADRAGMLNAQGNLVSLSVFSGITLLLPTNEAIDKAIGTVIPEHSDTTAFNYRDFLHYHIISERTLFTDDEIPQGDYGTDLFLETVRQRIGVNVSEGEIHLRDQQNNRIMIRPGPNANIITSNGVIHLVDQVVVY